MTDPVHVPAPLKRKASNLTPPAVNGSGVPGPTASNVTTLGAGAGIAAAGAAPKDSPASEEAIAAARRIATATVHPGLRAVGIYESYAIAALSVSLGRMISSRRPRSAA